MTFDPLLPVPVLAVLGLVTLTLAIVRHRRRAPRSTVVRSLAMVGLIIVIALDPAIGGGQVEARTSNVDVLFAVDTTGSIAAEDYDGTQPRIEGVRADVLAIAREFPGARFSMITFDTVARLEMPWTTDLGALEATVGVLRQERTYNSRGSRLDVGLDMIDTTLRTTREADPERKQVLFFFSDGEQTADPPPRTFSGLRRFSVDGAVLGYGTPEGGPMLRYTSAGYEYDSYIVDFATRQPAISHIDEENLKMIASQLDVGYYHRTAPGGLEVVASRIASSAGSGGFDPRPGARRLYWIPALGVVALALWQMACVVLEADDVRRMTRPSA